MGRIWEACLRGLATIVCAALWLVPSAVLARGEAATPAPASDTLEAEPAGQQIVVTASRADLLGRAATASEGSLTRREVALRPIYRPSELFESIPGMVVTVHSGEGKAPQYLIRGFNLDHGTDFANFVDDMPVNRPTNAHGQGYSDIGFLIPQLVGGIDFTKGPYFAGVGDFGSVASAHTRLVDELPAQAVLTIGSNGSQSLFAGGTLHPAPDRRLLAAVELTHYDGPWQPRQNFQKINAALRYSQGTKSDGLSVTMLFTRSGGGLTTDVPERAVDAGLIGRFGTLDPSDHSATSRYSVSAHLDKPVGAGQLGFSAYAVHSTMTLWNNFTHFLFDPQNGDQEQQDETRTTFGFAGSYSVRATIAGMMTETVIGAQLRHDTVLVDRKHTMGRTTVLPTCQAALGDEGVLTYAAVNGNCTNDRVHLLSLAPWVQETVHVTPWLRVTGGLRLDNLRADDRSLVTGTGGAGSQALWQPKGSIALGPWAKTELYFSIGRGFHSNDVRGVFGTVPNVGIPLAGGATPLLSTTNGMELGLRSDAIARLSLQLALFQQDFGSELIYNADLGSDEAGAPSRRQGLELSAQYHPFRWLELNTDLAFSRPRYRSGSLAAFGLAGPYISDAPNFIYSAGILVDGLGRWSGGLQWRRLGTHPLVDGQRFPQAAGYSEWNLDVAYALPTGWQVQLGLFNVFDSRGLAADFFYTSRLAGEPAEGVAGYQNHPLEPRAARIVLTRRF
ncbi:TonB-dependent receptor [Novosphingobium sp.]|uniref:TonB-dependent receptor n=1 Tax=Novosphingobium sp. TaxID=1874826 RepID=UPI0033404F1B